MGELTDRLSQLRSELDDHSRIAEHLSLDLGRPVRALGDGYPETTVSSVGNACERMLKRLWRYHAIEGDPDSKALNDLIKRCRPYIRSAGVLQALDDIRRLRNRAGHDGGAPIAAEDGLTAIRRLIDVLVWFTSTGSPALLGGEPNLAGEMAQRCEFLSGLYVTLGYRNTKRFVLTPDTVYQLFCRESGARIEYVEVMLSRDATDLHRVLTTTGGELLRTHLPKLTRFVILDEAHEALHALLGGEFRILRYDHVVSTLIDFEAHLPSNPSSDTELSSIPAAVLSTDSRTGEAVITERQDASGLLRQLVMTHANVLLVGRPGSGKSTLLRSLVSNIDNRSGTRQFRFYFDLSLKQVDETFPEYVTRLLAPCMRAERTRAYDLFLYLIRSGAALCAIDAIDEAVSQPSPAGFIELFADLAAVLSAESAVVMSSRVSFLADSPQARQLLDRNAARSEQLVEQLYVQGVDPARLPHCHLVRLADPYGTPLERQLTEALRLSQPASLDVLLEARINQVMGDGDWKHTLPTVLGQAFLEGRTTFFLSELHAALGARGFIDGQLSFDACVLAPLLRPAGPEQAAFAHTAYQELLAAHRLSSHTGREAAAELPRDAFVTEQVRTFLAKLPADTTLDCVLPAGVYIVGPAERLLLRRVHYPVRFDRHPVTVARYRQFLHARRPDGTSEWDHSDQPSHIRHTPWTERLRDPAYYDDPRYDNHPAICVSWWSAHAFATFEGKRLPTAIEWEAAARGTDGRLFPWGDDPTGAPINCADTWAGHPIVTYQAWKAEIMEGGAMQQGWVTPVGERGENCSPFGIEDMVGQVWEWTSTSLADDGAAVICGGSYDNPLRAVQTSSKGIYRKRGTSNAVGFRCVTDLGKAR